MRESPRPAQRLILDAAAMELIERRRGLRHPAPADELGQFGADRAARWSAALEAVEARLTGRGELLDPGRGNATIVDRLRELADAGDSWATQELRQIIAAYLASRAVELEAVYALGQHTDRATSA